MSASLVRSTLAKSLLIDFLLTSICLPHGDNSRDVIAAWRVGNNHYSTGEQAQSDKPFLSIIETVIDERNACAATSRYDYFYFSKKLSFPSSSICSDTDDANAPLTNY